MNISLSKFAGIFGLAALAAGGAQALTTIDSTNGNGGDLGAVTTPSGSTTDIDFAWGTVSASGYVQFTVDTAFDLFLTGYNGSPSGPQDYTGIILLEDGGPRYTTLGSFCDHAYVLTEIRGTCDLATNGPVTPNIYNPSAVTPIQSALAAGTYYVGYAESGQTNGTMSFQIAEIPDISEVPLPAGGLLLVGALGGLAALRRRKNAA